MATNRNSVGTSQPGLMSSSPFLGGLNTELSGIVDSTDFTKDELNMMIRADGSRSRRPGVDYEEGYLFNNELVDISKSNLAFNSIEWTDINSPDESQTYKQIPYLVVQIGSQVIFYKNQGQPYSKEEIDYTLDLTAHKLSGKTDEDVATARCKFTIAYGCLFITSSAIEPIRLRNAQDETVPYLPTSTPYCVVACTAYQGNFQRMGSCKSESKLAYCEFFIDDVSIGKYYVQKTNGDYTPFPNSYTLSQYFNSLPLEVRRHLTAAPFEQAPNAFTNKVKSNKWSPDDYITFEADSMSARGLKVSIKVYGWYESKMRIFHTSGSTLMSIWSSKRNTYSAVVAGGTAAYTAASGLSLQIRDDTRGAEDYLAVDESPEKLSYAHLYNLLNQGWTTELIADFYDDSNLTPKVFPANNLAQQYLKDKKTDKFKPEDIINMTFGNTPAARGHFKLDFFNQDRNSTADLTSAMQDVATKLGVPVADILDTSFPVSPDDPAGQVPVVKPRRDYIADTCAYAGRIFYLCGDVLLYSQIISESIENAGRCYSEADPTSEEISDVVETDGGFISLPDIGEGIKLAQFGQYLFVFGTRGNVVITGTANNIFTATAYSAGSLNSVPTQSPDSFVNTEFGVFYWGTTGINVLGSGESGLAVQDISTERILTWFGKLSNIQHQYCKGVYSSSKKKIYWFYPSNDEQPRRLDCCLVYDIKRGSFAPQKIATGYQDPETDEWVEPGLPEVVSGLSLKVPFKATREYPVIASAKNFTDLSNNYIRVSSKLNLQQNGCIYRVDLNGLSDLAIGDSIDLIRFGSYVIYKATRINDSTIQLQRNISGTHTYSVADTEILWMLMYYDNNRVYIALDLESNFPEGTYTASTVPGDLETYYLSRGNYDINPAGYISFYKPILGEIDDSYCEADFDTVNDIITGRYKQLEENPDVYLEVGEEIRDQLKYNMEGYRDAKNSEEYHCESIHMNIFHNAANREGAIFRCDFSAFDDMPNSSTKTLIKIRNSTTGAVEETITLYKDSSGDYTLTYTGTESSYGSFSGTDVIWFGVWNEWVSSDTVCRLTFGFCEESDLGGTGYTAQNLPDAAITYMQAEYKDNYTIPGVYYEFLSAMVGDPATGFSKVVVNLTDTEFVSRSGSLRAFQDYYYKEVGTNKVFTYDGEILSPVGEVRNEYGTDYLDVVLDGTRSYATYEDSGVSYYTYGNMTNVTAPVFVMEDGELVLYGFTTDCPTPSSMTFTGYDDPTSITASITGYLDDQKDILVLARDADKDTVINLSTIGNLINILADDPIDSEAFTYESSILVCLDVNNMKVTFGDFRNNLLMDWTAGDWEGPGYVFDSYLISHPMNATSTASLTGRRVTDLVHSKNMPYLITYFRRTETGELITGDYLYPSACQGSILWDWRTTGEEGKWSSPTELYRPRKKTILDSGYIINKTNIRGLGRAYQVKLESVGEKQLILEGLVYDLKNDGRI